MKLTICSFPLHVDTALSVSASSNSVLSLDLRILVQQRRRFGAEDPADFAFDVPVLYGIESNSYFVRSS